MKFQILLFLFAIGLVSCSSIERRQNAYKTPDQERPLVDEKYKLSADREKLNELRKELPPDKRKENDELAFTMSLMSEVRLKPADVRNKFDSALRKKREIFQKDLNKEREVFTKQERVNRDEFLKVQDQDRKEFLKTKAAKDQREDFFRTQDEKRRDFFANQREKRNDFESDMTERRKSFEDYAREKTNDFNQEHRAYVKKYEEMEKEKKKAKESGAKTSNGSTTAAGVAEPLPEVKNFLEELEEAYKKPSTKLESGE